MSECAYKSLTQGNSNDRSSIAAIKDYSVFEAENKFLREQEV